MSLIIRWIFLPPTANLPLPPAAAVFVPSQGNGASFPGSLLSCRPLSPWSWIRQHPLSKPGWYGHAGAGSGEAQTGGGGRAQRERHEVSLWVWGTFSRQHPGGVRHRNKQDSACNRGTYNHVRVQSLKFSFRLERGVLLLGTFEDITRNVLWCEYLNPTSSGSVHGWGWKDVGCFSQSESPHKSHLKCGQDGRFASFTLIFTWKHFHIVKKIFERLQRCWFQVKIMVSFLVRLTFFFLLMKSAPLTQQSLKSCCWNDVIYGGNGGERLEEDKYAKYMHK